MIDFIDYENEKLLVRIDTIPMDPGHEFQSIFHGTSKIVEYNNNTVDQAHHNGMEKLDMLTLAIKENIIN